MPKKAILECSLCLGNSGNRCKQTCGWTSDRCGHRHLLSKMCTRGLSTDPTLFVSLSLSLARSLTQSHMHAPCTLSITHTHTCTLGTPTATLPAQGRAKLEGEIKSFYAERGLELSFMGCRSLANSCPPCAHDQMSPLEIGIPKLAQASASSHARKSSR